MSSDSLVKLTLSSRVDGPCETLVLAARQVEFETWDHATDVVLCDRPSTDSEAPGVLSLQVHDLLAETGHLQVAEALGEIARYRVLAHRLMVAVVGALLLRAGLLLSDPEVAHEAIRAALDRLIDLALADSS